MLNFNHNNYNLGNGYSLCKSTTSISPARIMLHLGENRKLPIIFSEALGKVSPKIRRLRRLWREGFPERQLVAVSG